MGCACAKCFKVRSEDKTNSIQPGERFSIPIVEKKFKLKTDASFEDVCETKKMTYRHTEREIVFPKSKESNESCALAIRKSADGNFRFLSDALFLVYMKEAEEAKTEITPGMMSKVKPLSGPGGQEYIEKISWFEDEYAKGPKNMSKIAENPEKHLAASCLNKPRFDFSAVGVTPNWDHKKSIKNFDPIKAINQWNKFYDDGPGKHVFETFFPNAPGVSLARVGPKIGTDTGYFPKAPGNVPQIHEGIKALRAHITLLLLGWRHYDIFGSWVPNPWGYNAANLVEICHDRVDSAKFAELDDRLRGDPRWSNFFASFEESAEIKCFYFPLDTKRLYQGYFPLDLTKTPKEYLSTLWNNEVGARSEQWQSLVESINENWQNEPNEGKPEKGYEERKVNESAGDELTCTDDGEEQKN